MQDSGGQILAMDKKQKVLDNFEVVPSSLGSGQRVVVDSKGTNGQSFAHFLIRVWRVGWLILGSKLPGRVLPEHPFNLRLFADRADDMG